MPLFEPDSSEDEEPPVAPEPDQSELETAVPLASEGNNDDRTAPRDTPNVPQNPTTLDDTESVKDMPAPILNERHNNEASAVRSSSPSGRQSVSPSKASPIPPPSTSSSPQTSEVVIQQIQPPRAGTSYSGSKQLVFNNSGSFWHLSPVRRSTNSSSSDTRPAKRQRTESTPSKTADVKRSTGNSLKQKLLGFAMPGIQAAEGDGHSDSDKSDVEDDDQDDVVERHNSAFIEPIAPHVPSATSDEIGRAHV